MIGRASIGNPWFFNQVSITSKTGEHMPLPSIIQRIKWQKNTFKWPSIGRRKVRSVGNTKTIQIISEEFLILRNTRTIMVTTDHSHELFALFNDLKKEFSPQPVFS